MIELLAAAPLAFLVGVSLGLLGGGGSILAVPILVYVLGLEPKSAIATSLIVVGLTSLAGVLRHHQQGHVRLLTGLAFGGAGIVGAVAGSRVAALSAVPGAALLVAFAMLMLVVAGSMLRGRADGREPAPGDRPPRRRVPLLGFLTGGLTGLLGVGGGFVIVPALHLAAGLPVHAAVGTSLLVIALNCGAGLLGFAGRVPIHWELALGFAAVSVLGSVAGAALARRARPARLRRGFAIFVLVAATAILIDQGVRLLAG